jgi:hypothetical protein
VKSLAGPDAAEKIDMLQKIRHNNFLIFLDFFNFEGFFYIVFSYVPVFLAQIVVFPAYPTESQLAAILGQVSLPGSGHRRMH